MRAGARREEVVTGLDRAAGIVAILALMAGLVWASNARMPTYRAPDARLRLAWSARPERIEKCRQQSEEELARLPAHMRQPVSCEGTTAEYRLQVRHDGALVAERAVHGGGLRRDRRLYVFEEVLLPAGEATVDVRFDRVDASEPGATSAERDRERASLTPAQRGEVPPHLSLVRRFRFTSREVVLVTYDSDRQELTAVQQPPRGMQ
jgi:hypothetical protein